MDFNPVPASLNYAGRRRRLVAWIVDLLIMFLSVLILGAIGIGSDIFNAEAEPTVANQLVNAAFAFGYFFILTAALGGTLGKLALGLRVVDASGNKAGLGSLAVRELIARALGAIAIALLGAGIGEAVGAAVFIITAILILFDEKRQGLHDRIGRTYVVRVG